MAMRDYLLSIGSLLDKTNEKPRRCNIMPTVCGES
jgi:hypothetical protein